MIDHDHLQRMAEDNSLKSIQIFCSFFLSPQVWIRIIEPKCFHFKVEPENQIHIFVDTNFHNSVSVFCLNFSLKTVSATDNRQATDNKSLNSVNQIAHTMLYSKLSVLPNLVIVFIWSKLNDYEYLMYLGISCDLFIDLSKLREHWILATTITSQVLGQIWAK